MGAVRYHLRGPPDGESALCHAHTIQPRTCQVCDCRIRVHHKPVPVIPKDLPLQDVFVQHMFCITLPQMTVQKLANHELER